MVCNILLRKAIGKYSNKCFKYSANFCRSVSSNISSSRYKVRIIPALEDNYMYVLVDSLTKSALAIDPVEPEKILKCVNEEDVQLRAVLTTHHHLDHAGGNSIMREKIKNIPVYGFDERIEALTSKLSHDEVFEIDKTVLKCLHTPCHTSGHVCYFIDSDEPVCFTGDTLFIAGCGRFFEGSAEQMYKSLSILSGLPVNTKIYCGHEYTVSNLKFALLVEPDNKAILQRLKSAEESLRKGEPTVPSTIANELSFNPFMRAHEHSIQNFVGQTDLIAVIKRLRELKDNFKS